MRQKTRKFKGKVTRKKKPVKRAFNFPLTVEKVLLFFAWLFLFSRTYIAIKNINFYYEIKPSILEIEVGALILFFQSYLLNLVMITIVGGFLLLYYQRLNK